MTVFFAPPGDRKMCFVCVLFFFFSALFVSFRPRWYEVNHSNSTVGSAHVRSCTAVRATFWLRSYFHALLLDIGKERNHKVFAKKTKKNISRAKKFTMRQTALPVFEFFSFLSTLTTHITGTRNDRKLYYLLHKLNLKTGLPNLSGIVPIIQRMETDTQTSLL